MLSSFKNLVTHFIFTDFTYIIRCFIAPTIRCRLSQDLLRIWRRTVVVKTIVSTTTTTTTATTTRSTRGFIVIVNVVDLLAAKIHVVL